MSCDTWEYDCPSWTSDIKAGYKQRLENLTNKLDTSIKAIQELDENMKFIKEKQTVWNCMTVSNPALATHIPLHHSNHRDLIQSVKLILEVCKHLDQTKYEGGKDMLKLPTLKTLLQQAEMAFRCNAQVLQEIENSVSELQNTYKTIQSATNSAD